MRLNTFFRCHCGKLHTYGGLSYRSTCTCGRKLLQQVFGGSWTLPAIPHYHHGAGR